MEDKIHFVEPTAYSGAFAITPADGANLARAAKALYIGTAGALKVVTYRGDTVTFANVAVGLLPLAVIKVFAAGTAATGIIGLV